MFWISQVMRLKSSCLHDFSHEYIKQVTSVEFEDIIWTRSRVHF